MNPDPDPLTFVIPGDLHLTEAGLDNHEVASWMVHEVNSLIRPDVVQFIGDNVQHATDSQFRLFNDLRGRLDALHFALVGDHDIHRDPEARGFRSHVGETFGSLRLRGFRLVRLNTQEAKPAGISPSQIDWFRGEVDAASNANERVIIFQHNYPYQIWEDFSGPGIDDWRGIVQTRRIAAIFAGHTHYGQVANDGRNVSIATRSIGDPEGGPPGYTLAHAQGEDLAVTYRTVGDRGPVVLVTHPRESILATGPAHVVRGPDLVRVRIWSDSPLVSARGRIDGDDRFDLDSIGPGLWGATLPGDRLTKGEHHFEASAHDDRGRRASHRIAFLVDPTGRFTAVPSVSPAIIETAFC